MHRMTMRSESKRKREEEKVNEEVKALEEWERLYDLSKTDPSYGEQRTAVWNIYTNLRSARLRAEWDGVAVYGFGETPALFPANHDQCVRCFQSK